MTALRGLILDLWQRAPPAARQTAFLFGVDGVTNAVDYGFHVYLGRALAPGAFAAVETVSAVVLVVVTAFGVLQPVVARYVAEAETPETADANLDGLAIFQRYFGAATLLGLALSLAAWLARGPLAGWLNVPPLAVGLVAGMALLALLRPVVAGTLQGHQRFVAFGLTRTVHAVGRLGAALLLLALSGGLLGAVAAFPIGALLALGAGLGFLGRAVWRPAPLLPRSVLANGLRLTAGAFVAYAAYMALLNSDLIWVNRSFPPATAGSYATAVLLRRVLALMPGAAVVVMYPRAVAQVARGQVPDRLLVATSAAVLASTLALTAVYFAAGDAIVRLAFGAGYDVPAALLGWMGVAMLGYGLAAVWLNLYLATRPAAFVGLLAATALIENLLLARFHGTLAQVVAAFGLGGWVLALGGLAIYLFGLRPRLVRGG